MEKYDEQKIGKTKDNANSPIQLGNYKTMNTLYSTSDVFGFSNHATARYTYSYVLNNPYIYHTSKISYQGYDYEGTNLSFETRLGQGSNSLSDINGTFNYDLMDSCTGGSTSKTQAVTASQFKMESISGGAIVFYNNHTMPIRTTIGGTQCQYQSGTLTPAYHVITLNYRTLKNNETIQMSQAHIDLTTINYTITDMVSLAFSAVVCATTGGAAQESCAGISIDATKFTSSEKTKKSGWLQ